MPFRLEQGRSSSSVFEDTSHSLGQSFSGWYKKLGARNHRLELSKQGPLFHLVASSATFNLLGTHRHCFSVEIVSISPTRQATYKLLVLAMVRSYPGKYGFGV